MGDPGKLGKLGKPYLVQGGMEDSEITVPTVRIFPPLDLLEQFKRLDRWPHSLRFGGEDYKIRLILKNLKSAAKKL